MKVTLQGVTKKFGQVAAVNGVSLEINDGELFFLLGPSGCGKTTALRLLAGFYQPDAGEIRFDGRVVNGVPPNKRGTGMVFQNYALWPHLTVFENVAYGLDVRHIPPAEKKQRVLEALAVVRMAELAERTPNELSGGQQQRVALARALVIKPAVLLLDEPLSNLDAQLRLEMRDEIRRIHAETGHTTVYVTHDQKEALSLAARIAVMRDGQVEQVGTPRDLYRTPRNRFVAGFMGEGNFINGVIAEGPDPATVRITTAEGDLVAARNGPAFAPGQPVTCLIRPESLAIDPNRASNRFDAQLREVSYLGEVEQFVVELPRGAVWKGLVQNPGVARQRGERLSIAIQPQDILVLERRADRPP